MALAVSRILAFNDTFSPFEPRIRGIKLDLEPYSLPGWHNRPEKHRQLAANYIALLQTASIRIKGKLPLWVDIPVQYLRAENQHLLHALQLYVDGATLMAYFRGSIDQLQVRQGSHVKKGQLLFSITSESPAERSNATADETVNADILRAGQLRQIKLQQARIDFKLAQKGNNPYQLTLKIARLRYDALLYETSGSTSDVATPLQASAAPAKTLRFFASGDGVVTTMNVNRRDFVLPGQLLAVIADLKHRWLNAYVPPQKASHIRRGQPATLYVAGHPHGISTAVTSRGIVVATPEALLERMPDVRRSLYVRIDFQGHAGQDILPGSILKIVIEP